MLLGEWTAQQRIEDARTYKLMCCWLKDPPAPETLFPLLGMESDPQPEDEDDAVIFQRTAASLSSGNTGMPVLTRDN